MIEPGAMLPRKNDFGLILALSLFTLAVHLAINAFSGYGIFRDEFYYIACSKRLAAGYVDQPPLAMFLMAAGRTLFGASQFAIRILPAISHALTVFLVGLIAQKFGGRKMAAVLACLATAMAPIIVGTTNIFQMNAFAFPLWALAAYILVLIAADSRPRLWILLGMVMGLGLLNKVDFLWFGAGLAAGLLLTDMRKHLLTPWPYVAAGIALLIFSPFVIWNAVHHFPHIEFIKNATAGKYSGLTRLEFVAGQAVLPNPVNLALWLPGLFFLLVGKEGRKFRILGLIFLTAFVILLANGHSKAEYLAPAYPMLFAAGGVAVERFPGRAGKRWAAPALVVVSALTSIALMPFVTPALPVKTYIRYAALMGVRPSTAESKALAELPQFYADMFGWEELARDVSAVYLSLPADERTSCVVFATNYGEAASLEYYAKRYPVPRVICTHNSYWMWGYPKDGMKTIIALRGKVEDLRKACANVRLAAIHICRYCMPYENNMPIFVCQGLRIDPAVIWKNEKSFN